MTPTNTLLAAITAELTARDSAIAAANAAVAQLQAAIDAAQTTVTPPPPPPEAPVIALDPNNPNLVRVVSAPASGTLFFERADESFNVVDSGWFQGDGSYHPGGNLRVCAVQTEGSIYGPWSNWLLATQ